LLTALEWPRAAFEASTLPAAWLLLRRAPRGDGHPVLVLPGYWAGDGSTAALRGYLRALGHRAHRWGLGWNLGLEDGVGGSLLGRLVALSERHGRAVSLVGWSLGGVYARELAKLAPERVRQVVTLGSPFGMGRGGDGWLKRVVYGRASRPAGRICDAPPVPSTAIVSRSDGIAGFRACCEVPSPYAETVQVPGSHLGLGLNPIVLFAIADRLAQPEGAWKSFDRSGLRGVLYA
jgi:pimeloyl-ACP methyl ester carboxylesterase